MALPAETQIGPYKIVALIGSGGMGEVYKAHDTRLQRDVALKVLPASFTHDADRLRRFELEARSVAALNHPNIVAVYDVGTAPLAGGDVHYIVSELLDGDTLRQRIPATGLPAKRAIELAVQLANGLGAAHEQGIVHRDLKPENIFVTRNGRLKILDFGLAKLQRPEQVETVTGATATGTHAGHVLGTIGYMSPEQVRGEPADQRSDIFSFGSILYEMLSGARAFKKGTGAETMTAILNEEPPEFSPKVAIAPALDRIVRHCMEKQPAQRFQSAHDIAFDLESVSTTSTVSAIATGGRSKALSRWIAPAIAAVAILGAGLALGMWVRPSVPDLHPRLHRITFSRLTVLNARFTPDGNLIYGASLEGRPPELFSAPSGSVESRAIGMPSTNILAVAANGELAVQSNPTQTGSFSYTGMLARAPQIGGAPRPIAEGVEYADWAPDGSLAIVRRVGGKIRLEYPLGKILYESAGWISHPRISPDGSLVAFLDHPYPRDDAGSVAIVDKGGQKKTLSTLKFVSTQGLAWHPVRNEVWFSATTSGSSRALYAVAPGGKERLVYLGTGTLTLHDISKEGRVLFSRDDWRSGMLGLAPGAIKERDLSWHDWTIARDLTEDGKTVAFDETGEAGEATGAFYVRGTDGSPAVRLGNGASPQLSRDGKRVLALMPGPDGNRRLAELPTGAGEVRTIATGDVQVQTARYFPDEKRILELGNAINANGQRLWVQDADGVKPRPITPEGVDTRLAGTISPDGKQVAAVDPNGKISIYPVDGGDAIPVPGSEVGERPLEWLPNGKSLLVVRAERPNVVYEMEISTGKRKPFRTIPVPDGMRGEDLGTPIFSADFKSYVYAYTRIVSDLYIVDGLQ